MNKTEPGNHGNSIAAWTVVALILVGSVLIGFGVAFGSQFLDIAGLVICAVGAAAGKLLSKAGYGAPPLQAPGQPGN